jgi:hypothetical protein
MTTETFGHNKIDINSTHRITTEQPSKQANKPTLSPRSLFFFDFPLLPVYLSKLHSYPLFHPILPELIHLRCPTNRALSYLVSSCRSSYLTTPSPTAFRHTLLGGLNTCSRPLASLLVPVNGEPLVSVSIPFLFLPLPLSNRFNPEPPYC